MEAPTLLADVTNIFRSSAPLSVSTSSRNVGNEDHLIIPGASAVEDQLSGSDRAGYTDEEIADLKEAFAVFDSDGDQWFIRRISIF